MDRVYRMTPQGGNAVQHPGAPNGLEMSCPAEAGEATRTLGQASGQDKPPRRPRPPGQLQQVVGRTVARTTVQKPFHPNSDWQMRTSYIATWAGGAGAVSRE